MTTAFPALFSPQKLGRLVLKNRICMSAHADSLGEQGLPTERAVRYYEARARGGVGLLMCFGSASVHPASSAPPTFERLFTKGVTLHCHLSVVRLEPGRAVVRNLWSGREEVLAPFDAFVYAYGGEAVNGLEASLSDRVPRLELVGDCFAPRTLQHAILEGHKIARAL